MIRMPFRCEAFDQIAAALPAWNAVRAEHDNLFTDPRFISAMEATTTDASRPWSAIVRNDRDQPTAIASLFSMPLDLAMLAGGPLQQLGTVLRRWVPDALKYRALFCGLPVSAGQSQLGFTAQAPVQQCLQVLVGKMTELARPSGARFLIFKELDDSAADVAQGLLRLGFYRGESPPMNHFPAGFGSFAEYLAALKAPYRSKIVRSRRKMQQHALRVERLRGSEVLLQRFTPAVHQMYLDVVAKSPLRLEVLPREWFVEMVRQFPQESAWTAIYAGEHLLAWAYGLLADGVYHSLFGGVDYCRNGETDAYFNLLYEEMEVVLHAGAHAIHLGQTADDFKSRLGAMQSRRWFFIKPLRWKARAVLHLAAEQVLPSYPPPVTRHVFHTERRGTDV